MRINPASLRPFAAAVLLLVAAIFDFTLISTAISEPGSVIYLRPVAMLGFSAWMLFSSLSAAKDGDNDGESSDHQGAITVGSAALVAVAIATVLWLAVDKLA